MVEIHFTRWPFISWKRESLSDKAIGGVALATGVVAGSTFNTFAKSLRTSLSPLSLLFVSEILTAIFVMLSFGLVPVFKEMLHIPRAQWKWLACLAILSGIGGPLLWFTGLSYTTAINAGFFAKAEVIFLLLLAQIVLKEKITMAHVAAICTVIAGIAVISLQGFTQGLQLQTGDLLIMLAVFCYAAANIIFRNKLHGIAHPHVALFCRSLTAIGAFFLVSPFIEHPFISEIQAFPAALFPALIGFAFISRFLNSVTYYVAIDRLPVTTISVVSALDIIGGTVFAFLVLGEPILWYHYLGGAFILLGNILLELLGTHASPDQQEAHLKQRMV